MEMVRNAIHEQTMERRLGTYSEGSALRMEPMSRRAWGLPACWSMREDRTKPFF